MGILGSEVFWRPHYGPSGKASNQKSENHSSTIVSFSHIIIQQIPPNLAPKYILKLFFLSLIKYLIHLLNYQDSLFLS